MRTLAVALALAVTLALGLPLAAQIPPPSNNRPWIVVGAKAGWEYEAESPSVGTFLRIPLYFSFIEFVPSGEMIFQGNGLTERQLNGDLAIFINRGTFVGAGGVLLNTIPPGDGGAAGTVRETVQGYSLFFGVRAPPEERKPSFQLELRWTFLEDLNDPRFLQVGLGWPLVRLPF